MVHTRNPFKIIALQEVEVDGSLEARRGVPYHPGQHDKTPSLLKIQKLAGRGSVHL